MANRAGRLLGAGLAGVLTLLTVGPADPARAGPAALEASELGLPQLRRLAQNAVAAADFALADALAREILARDANDRTALLVLTLTAAPTGGGKAGVQAGARAYALSRGKAERFEAARLTARSAFQSGAHLRSQLWLRRAMLSAETPAQRELTARDYRLVRAQNPLRFELRFSAAQSDNVNGGSSGDLITIDGIDAVGYLSPSAQALSGFETWLRLSAGYTLAESQTSRTRIGALASFREIRLSEQSRRKAPDLADSDFRARLLEASLTHERSLRPGTALSLTAGLGQQDYGGRLASQQLMLGLGAEQKLGKTALISIGAGIEQRRLGERGEDAESATRLSLQHRQMLAVGSVGLAFSLRDIASERENNRARSLELVLDWQPAKPLGPVDLSLAFGGGVARYADYSIGPIVVPGGREDRSLFGSLELSPTGYGLGGFVPTLRVTASQTDSNVSRFNSNQLSFQLGLRSAF